MLGGRYEYRRPQTTVISLFIMRGCIDVGHFVENLCQHIIRYFGIYLCRFDVRVPQHPADDFDADTLHQRVGRGERVAALMIGYRLVDADFCRYFLQHPVAVGDIGHKQYEVRSRDLTFVTGDDALRDAAQFDYERRARLLPLLNNP